MRRKHNLTERLNTCRSVIIGRLELYHGAVDNITGFIDVERVFGNANPVRLEIGCGKGEFICRLAALNPGVNFIAVEKSENVIVTAAERALSEKTTNLRYIIGMAEYIGEAVRESGVSRIYLNFSSPYPKARQEKLRLTHPRFLEIYRKILEKNGEIELKTDDGVFFDYSLNSFAENNFTVTAVLRDLHNGGFSGNIMTEYEKNFAEQGKKIYYLKAIK